MTVRTRTFVHCAFAKLGPQPGDHTPKTYKIRDVALFTMAAGAYLVEKT